MEENHCIFCKLISGEIPSNIIYEDKRFCILLDAAPASRGHALIIPKKHSADLYELDEDTAGELMKLAKKAAIHMKQTLRCDGLNLVQNNGKIAGQTVFHFHLHMIPRYQNMQNNDILTWNQETFTKEEMEEICRQLSFPKKR